MKSWSASSKDLKGNIAVTKVYRFLHVQVPGDWPCNGSSSSQCGVWEDTLCVFWTCAICEVHSSTKGLLISKSEGLWLLAWGWGDDRGLRSWGLGFRIWSRDWKIVCPFPEFWGTHTHTHKLPWIKVTVEWGGQRGWFGAGSSLVCYIRAPAVLAWDFSGHKRWPQPLLNYSSVLLLTSPCSLEHEHLTGCTASTQDSRTVVSTQANNLFWKATR